MRGRKPKPAGVKRAEGNRGKRRIHDELAVTRLRPELPEALSRAGRVWLETILPELERVGVLTIIDGASLAAMAEAKVDAEWWRGRLEIEQRKRILNYETLLKISREVARKDEAFRRWASEYGLTAVSRTRLGSSGGGRDGGSGDGPTDDLDD